MSAQETGQLASLLRSGLYAQAAALELARSPQAITLAMEGFGEGQTGVGSVQCNDGTTRLFDLPSVLDLMRSDPGLRDEMDRAWCVSSLILLGDRLAEEGYFDRAPVLEMVRHLRNGVAHGNRFGFHKPEELESWPAHTREAACWTPHPFEITPDLEGTTVLFDFMGPGDILDLLISVSTYLQDEYKSDEGQ